MSHDHHIMMVGMPMVTMESAIPSVMMMAAFDHNGLGAGDRRRRDGDGGECGNDVSKLLHVVLSSFEQRSNFASEATFPKKPKRILNSRSAKIYRYSVRCDIALTIAWTPAR
jgi:hypothetical protein